MWKKFILLSFTVALRGGYLPHLWREAEIENLIQRFLSMTQS